MAGRVVISQPMFFPWVGMFEQIRQADVYVHYDDVPFSKGSFTNRVQIKAARGSHWLTLPLKNLHLGRLIKDVRLIDDEDWRGGHVAFLEQTYRHAPFCAEMLDLVSRVYADPDASLCELTVASMMVCCDYFDLRPPRGFHFSSSLGIPGKSWERVLAVVEHFGGDVYVTGHGARDYLDHEAFEARGVRVEYLDYRKVPYPQLYGEFTPFVSILDLIANVGRKGREVICSPRVAWREFLHGS
ncbi:MAG: WbqC family protein [Planctomycetes bacterium]|nr:WbqC family protein [Planctomycetota bacterium]